jgi:hypothetical protein
MDLPRTLKQRINAQLRPVASRMAALGLVGDRLQWMLLGFAAVTGALLLAVPAVLPGLDGVLLLLPVALLVRAMACAVAEVLEHDHPRMQTRDAALREVIDAGADLLLYLPLATYPGVAPVPVVLLVVIGLLAEIAGLAAATRGGARRRDGPMGYFDRALVFGLAGLILAVDPRTAPWLPWLLLPAAGLAAATILVRLRSAGPG